VKATETVLLTEYIQALCPQQAIGEYTADAWHDVLGDLELDDCKAAAVAVAKRQPFIAPAEIRAEVRRVREERIGRNPLPAPPPDAAEQPGRYQRIIRANVERLASARDLNAALTGVGATPPSDPTDEYRQARGQLARKVPAAMDAREKARRQVEEARRDRARGEGRQP
jgi:hypothetical protein